MGGKTPTSANPNQCRISGRNFSPTADGNSGSGCPPRRRHVPYVLRIISERLLPQREEEGADH